MTTPDTSAVRAWARENGYEVADRGRLPAEITDAYTAAHGAARRPGGSKAGKAAPTSAARKAPAKKPAAPANAPAPAKVPAPAAAAPAPAADSASGGPGPKPSRVADDRRLVALGEQLAALTERVERLEKASGGKDRDKDKDKFPRFRRRS